MRDIERPVYWAGMLESGKERINLLKKGFTGREIAALYVTLNGFEIMEVDWHEPAGP